MVAAPPLYHVAPRAARESVLAFGLDPARAADQHDRTADPDQRPDDAESHLDGPRAPGVWVYSDLDDARDWAQHMGEQEIWVVQTALVVREDPFASTEHGYYTDGPVPASVIARLLP